MKGQSKAASHAEYIAQLEEPRKSDIAALDTLIRKLAPKMTPFMCNGMLAYGPYHYKTASGCEGEWFRIGLASNKNYISLYLCASDATGYVAERFKEALPKANIGRSCVRFKRLADLDSKTLQRMIRETAKAPALGVSAGK